MIDVPVGVRKRTGPRASLHLITADALRSAPHRSEKECNLTYPPNIFSPVCIAKTEVNVQAMTQVVAIENIDRNTACEKLMCSSIGNCAFTGT